MRLVSLYNSATPEMRTQGAAWYLTARKAASAMAEKHGTTRSVAAGVIAALSPRIQWVRNLAVADSVLATGTATGVFRANLAKAQLILAGVRPLLALGGSKVRAFYRAIMGDSSAAVIDVWMLRAIGFKGAKLSEKAYQRTATAMAKAAKIVGTTVVQLQATVWTVIRGKST